MTVTGILLAAGRGRRFDPSGRRNKLLQTLGAEDDSGGPGSAVVVLSARHLLAALPRVVAVVRPGAEAVAAQLLALGCELTTCPLADTGMAASLAHAIGRAREADGWVVALGDMPHVQPSTIQSLKTALEQGAGIAAPMYRGQRGNPVGFSRRYLPQLLALEGDQGARGILKHSPVTELDVDDIGILQDVDTQADLHPKDNT
ncbi:nucleotidyltransferase family protein [Pseudoduganella sp. LjRoot289]|uniref:nucleotidyltransferase family protein n=1 Tax=Pseudoduganella sp. LjRoot289 TaxID=3342314 RepID=UPI003ED12E6F